MELPEGCIANILSHTTPADACRLSAISKLFRSAAESDAVWGRFLPSDVVSIFSQSDSHASLLASSPSKKALFLALSGHPIIIDQGKKSFQLDKRSGKKCYMLAARALAITWGDTPFYWKWTTLPGSRFPEVALLSDVWWLEIRGKMNTLALSPNTQYAAYFVFNMVGSNGFDENHVDLDLLNIRFDHNGFENCLVELSVSIFGGESSTKNVCLNPDSEGQQQSSRVMGLRRPNMRSDGWLEIEMGVFFNSGLEDEEVQMSVVEIKAGIRKSGLIIEGIEVRPKE